MKKKYLIIICILLGIAAVFVFFFISSSSPPKKVQINFDATDGVHLRIYQRKGDALAKEGQPIQTLTASGSIMLPKGKYVAEPTGNNIDQTLIPVEVGNTDVKQTVTIRYTRHYLDILLQDQQDEITSVITSAYGAVQSNYTISAGKLFRKGEWYGTSLVYKGTDTDNRDTLHLVMKKVNQKWTLVTKPKIILNVVDDKDIPSDIIKATNTMDTSPSPAPETPPPTYFIDYNSQGAR